MEKEIFISGYCRVQDQSRMVCAVVVDGKVEETDCCYGNCIYQANCVIAQQIDELTK